MTRPRRRPSAVAAPITGLVLVLGALLLAACGDGGSTASGRSTAGDGTGAASDLAGTLTVSAATSLRAAFEEIGDDFTADHPDVEVVFNFDSSSRAATQILEGAPADVYASADEATMARLVDDDRLAGEPVAFARNRLAIVTRAGNPEGITGLADLDDVGVVSLCGDGVPCGSYAERALARAGVSIPESDVTRGQDVGATLAAVADGDAVAGIVYVTDARSAGDAVTVVEIPVDRNVVATYPIGILDTAADRDVAAAFVAHVLGDEGRAVLADHGFRAPA